MKDRNDVLYEWLYTLYLMLNYYKIEFLKYFHCIFKKLFLFTLNISIINW